MTVSCYQIVRRVVTGCRDDRVMLAEYEKSSDRVQG